MDATFDNIISQLSEHNIYLGHLTRTKVSPIKKTPLPAKKKSGK
jgi:hypothetical protein